MTASSAEGRERPVKAGSNAYDYVRRVYGLNVQPGDRVEVQGEGAGLNGTQGLVKRPRGHEHYVHVLLDGRKSVSLFHPDSIRPVSVPPSGGKA